MGHKLKLSVLFNIRAILLYASLLHNLSMGRGILAFLTLRSMVQEGQCILVCIKADSHRKDYERIKLKTG